MDCKSCKEERKQGEAVPRWTHEADMARMERTIKKLWILLIIILALLFGTNAGWIWYESQFVEEVVTQEVTQDADNGENHFIGGDYYGATESENND